MAFFETLGVILQFVLEGLNRNSGSVTAFATIAIVFLTCWLAIENRRLRKAGTEPEVIAYLMPHPDGTGAINFVVANIGQGPAKNVRFELDFDESDFVRHEVLLFNDKRRVRTNILPQGEKISALFGVSNKLAGTDKKQEILKPFTVNITYDDLGGKLRSSTHTLDVSQFLGLKGLFGKPTSREIADSLKGINENIGTFVGKMSSSMKSVDATSIEDEARKVQPTGPVVSKGHDNE